MVPRSSTMPLYSASLYLRWLVAVACINSTRIDCGTILAANPKNKHRSGPEVKEAIRYRVFGPGGQVGAENARAFHCKKVEIRLKHEAHELCSALKPTTALMVGAAGRLLDLLKHCIQVEGGRLLTRWKFSECPDLLGNEILHTVEEIGVGDHPVPIGIRVFVRTLEGIAAQIEHFRRPQLHERLEPTRELSGSLFHEHHFPVAHANCQDVAVVADIEEKLPGAFLRFAGQVGKQVVAINMDLVAS